MFIVVYRPLGAETQYHGPFTTNEQAYDFTCTLPAPCEVKFTEELRAPPTVYKLIMAKPDASDYVTTSQTEFTNADLTDIALSLGHPRGAMFPYFAIYENDQEIGAGGGPNSGKVGELWT